MILIALLSKDNTGEMSLCALSVDIPYLFLSETADWADGPLVWPGIIVLLLLYGCEHSAFYSV